MNVWCKCAKLIPSTEVITTYCQNVLTVLGYSGVKRLLYTPCDKVYRYPPSKTFIDAFDAFSSNVRRSEEGRVKGKWIRLFFFFLPSTFRLIPFFFAESTPNYLTTNTNINISRNSFDIVREHFVQSSGTFLWMGFNAHRFTPLSFRSQLNLEDRLVSLSLSLSLPLPSPFIFPPRTIR